MIEYKDYSRKRPLFLTLVVSFTKDPNCVAENCYSGFLKVSKQMHFLQICFWRPCKRKQINFRVSYEFMGNSAKKILL